MKPSTIAVAAFSVLCAQVPCTVAAHDAVAARDAASASAIEHSALEFEEAWYTGNAQRMAAVLHPSFTMRHVGTDPSTGRSTLDQNVDARALVELTRQGHGEVPAAMQQHDVTVLDVYANAATAKIATWYGVDYLQLARWNGRWLIMSVVWGKAPGVRSPPNLPHHN
ncbi:nuclear transport factor 2 family protein [Rhodanobacter aciditrophus]|uniref:nuclear transport factor 2 family protein n=1 Tax=Rhodanobacter aciditrophus TaxID=1623218 RepID=UPI003CF7396C